MLEFRILAHLQTSDLRRDQSAPAPERPSTLASGLADHLLESARCFSELDAPTQDLLSALLQGDQPRAAAALREGADPDATEDGQAGSMTALMLAALDNLPEALESLIAAGADLEATDYQGWTALHHSAFNLRGDTFGALLRAGANPEARTQEGKLPADFLPDRPPSRKARFSH